ncbi:MAG: phosphate transport system regulatory protein PhoU, partial [Oscillospiraceae bacterium]|nr:phosphate transport system regulatory protein PhoU [Oscillospiraceae bacterium]
MSLRKRYERELKDVFDNLTLMCRHVEVVIAKSIKALTERDFELAREVCEEEKVIDRMEREIEHS